MTGTMKPQSSPTPWRVVSQQQTVGRSGAGGFTPGVDITFTFGDGDTGQLFIPATQYNPASVHALITAQVQRMLAISSLSSESDLS